jgi:hypothetical protein
MNKSLNLVITAVLLLGVSACSRAEQRGPGGEGGPGERPVFSTVDIDGNGEINFEEFSQQNLPGGDVKEIFDSIDADKDGIITEQEFLDHKPPAPPRN